MSKSKMPAGNTAQRRIAVRPKNEKPASEKKTVKASAPKPAKKVAAPKPAKKVAAPKVVKPAKAPKAAKPQAPKQPRKYAKGEHPGSVAGVSMKVDSVLKLGDVVAKHKDSAEKVASLPLPCTAKEASDYLKANGTKTSQIALRWYVKRGYIQIAA